MGIVTTVETAIDQILNVYVTSKVAAMCGMLVPVAVTTITVYIIMTGYSVMKGEAQDSLTTVVWRFFKLSFITGIALSAGEFQATVIDFLNGVSGALTSVFGANTLGSVIDNASQPYLDLSSELFNQASAGTIPNISLVCAGLMAGLGYAVIVVISAGMYFLAKIGLALLFACGPAFIFCACFPATQKYAEVWIAQSMQYILQNVFLAASISMVSMLMQQYAQSVFNNSQGGDANIIVDSLSLLAITIGTGIVVLNTKGMATALSGGVGINGIGSTVGQKIMQLAGGNRGPKPPKPSSTPQEGRNQLSQSGAKPSNSGALYNRQALENIRKASA